MFQIWGVKWLSKAQNIARKCDDGFDCKNIFK